MFSTRNFTNGPNTVVTSVIFKLLSTKSSLSLMLPTNVECSSRVVWSLSTTEVLKKLLKVASGGETDAILQLSRLLLEDLQYTE